MYQHLAIPRDLRDYLINAYRELTNEYSPIIFELSSKMIFLETELTRLHHILGE